MSMRTVVLAAGLTLLPALPSMAGVLVFGPYPDFQGYEDVTTYTYIPTQYTTTYHIPYDGTVTITITDLTTVAVTQKVAVYVPSYVRIKIFGDPIIEDPLSFFDIYAQDLDPGNPGTRLTGFNASSPELVPLSNETFFGVSGTAYSAPMQTVLVADLATLLPDFDLSAFAGADPGSIVYVAGPANIPLADVPEPASLTLLAMGALAVIRRRR